MGAYPTAAFPILTDERGRSQDALRWGRCLGRGLRDRALMGSLVWSGVGAAVMPGSPHPPPHISRHLQQLLHFLGPPNCPCLVVALLR